MRKHQIRRYPCVLACIALLAVLGFSSPALAHRVTVFAWVDGDTIHTESRFSGGNAVKEGKIAVYDEEGHVLVTGTTDEKGLFSFPVPGRQTLKIDLEAGTGHKNFWVIDAQEFEGDVASSKSGAEQPHAQANSQQPHQPPSAQPAGLSQVEIEAIVERALKEKLAPIQRQLAADRQKGPTTRDVLAGIGYILGLVGVGAYVNYRRKAKEIDRR